MFTALTPLARPSLMRAITLLLLAVVALAVSSAPVSAGSIDDFAASGEAGLVVNVLQGGSGPFTAPVHGALVLVIDVTTGQKVTYAFTNRSGVVEFRLKPGTYSLYVEAKRMAPQRTGGTTLVDNETKAVTVTMYPDR